MPEANSLNAMTTSIIANDMSKTLFKSNFESKIPEYCKKVLDYEVDDLSLDRTRRSIGIYPSELHAYEIISMAPQALEAGLFVDGRSFPLETNTLAVGQIEMAIKLAKPTSLVVMSSHFFSLPLDYLESLGIENVYVPNDENVYRAENIYLNRECPVNVLDPADLYNGIFPDGVEMFVAQGPQLSAIINQDLIEQMYDHLPVGGVIFVANSNDYMAYYDNLVSPLSTNIEVHPMYDLNTSIYSLPNALVYHIPTGSGFTVIIKG